MNPVSSASASVAAAVSAQTIASLQAQMARYSQSAGGQNSQASADYKALQAAIKSGNVSDAQAALSRLQRDSRTTGAATSATAPSGAPKVDSDGDQDGSTSHSLNVTA